MVIEKGNNNVKGSFEELKSFLNFKNSMKTSQNTEEFI